MVISCAGCGSSNVTTRKDIDRFQYNDKGALVDLAVEVTVFSCADCELEYTDHEAEKARELAVKRYLGSKKWGSNLIFLNF